jgi:hypothetical protein
MRRLIFCRLPRQISGICRLVYESTRGQEIPFHCGEGSVHASHEQRLNLSILRSFPYILCIDRQHRFSRQLNPLQARPDR